MRISDYPVPQSVDGSEMIAAMKDGVQVAIPPALLVGAGAGAPGLSAYQIWRQQGHTGTEADFLTSLVGPAGGGSGATLPSGQLVL